MQRFGLAIRSSRMAANRDPNPQHPIRAAAWHLTERLARRARRRLSDLVIHAADQQHRHTTGRPLPRITHPDTRWRAWPD